MYNFKKYIDPKPEQIAFWETRAKYVACDCGRGSGKTDIAIGKLARMLMTDWHDTERSLFLVGLPTQEQANKVAMDKILPLLPREVIQRVNFGMHYIDTIFNNRCFIKGMFTSMRSEGVQYTGVILDEMSDMPPGVIESLVPAMAHKCRFFYCLGVPKRNGTGASMYRTLCEKWAAKMVEGDPLYARYHWTSVGIVDADTLKQAEDLLTEKAFREQYMASWETASGAVYYAFSKENVVKEAPIDKNRPLLISCDFNVNPMSWVVCQADLDADGGCCGTITVIDEIRLTDTNTREALDFLWQLYPNHPGGYRFYGDAASHQRNTASTSAAPSDYAIISMDRRFYDRRQGQVDLNFPAANPPVLDRVECVNSMLMSASGKVRLHINERCTSLITDFERVTYKPGSRMIEKGDLSLTHTSDALGYLVYYIAPLGYTSYTMMGGTPGGI